MINEVTRILMSDTPLAISETGYRYLLSLAYPKVEQQSSTPSSESATVPRSFAARPPLKGKHIPTLLGKQAGLECST